MANEGKGKGAKMLLIVFQSMYGSSGGLKAAVEAAARLDANLSYKRPTITPDPPKAYFKNTDVQKVMQAEYSINHCPQHIRNLLCKGATQERIRELCDAYVATKGRYIAEPECAKLTLAEKSDKAFGLYLFIQGPNQRAIDMAIRMIENIIMTGNVKCPPPSLNQIPITQQVRPQLAAMPPPQSILVQPQYPSHQFEAPPPPMNGMQVQPPSLVPVATPQQPSHPAITLIEKVPIGIENSPPAFNLPMKLIGQNGSNLHYIRNETGAIVTLRGIGSAFIEPTTGQESPEVLHFSIEHSKPEGLAAAKELALNLIATIQQEYFIFQAAHGIPQSNVEARFLVHQSVEEQIIQQPMIATSIALPIVQTGIIQHPPVMAHQQFTQPPPIQMTIPPPGVHVPPQTGASGNEPASQTDPNAYQQPMALQQSGVPVAQQPQQQYVIQGAQPVQGIMTSQGIVVLNQQPQQIIFSQPGQPPQSATILHQGQIPLQQSPGQQIPVSYQFQYVQQPANTVAVRPEMVLNSPGHVHMQQPGTSLHFTQPQLVSVSSAELTMAPPMFSQAGQPVMQMKHAVQHQQVQMVPYGTPQVQYVTAPGTPALQNVEKTPNRSYKRKFTDEREILSDSKQPTLSPTKLPVSTFSQQSYIIQQSAMLPIQGVPHPSMTTQVRQGIGESATHTPSHHFSMRKPENSPNVHQPGVEGACEGAQEIPAGNPCSQAQGLVANEKQTSSPWLGVPYGGQNVIRLPRPDAYETGYLRRDKRLKKFNNFPNKPPPPPPSSYYSTMEQIAPRPFNPQRR